MCLTGAFTHLPIHAAGKLSEGVSDYAVLSYTPTLGALLNARRDLQPLRTTDARFLLAIVSKGFQWSHLPYAEEEKRAIEAVVPNYLNLSPSGDYEGTPRNGTTAQEVLAKLPEAAILHLACHGHQNLQNPLESGFVMCDKMLTVEALMALRPPRAFFAFLSACETAKGDEKQPDQAVHLAATLLFAGFKSVIGTMW